jgi:hypothetical protein
VVAFVDAELRMPPGWLARAAAASRAHPGTVIEGAIEPDPGEGILMQAALRVTRSSTPPAQFAPASNIVYPRALLERLDGWDERLPSDVLAGVDLAARAQRAGAGRRADPELIAYASVRAVSPAERVRSSMTTRDLPWALNRYPELRAGLPLRILRRRSHGAMALALAAALASRRHPAAALLALPWAASSARGVPISRLPGQLGRRAVEDLGEMALLAWGSARHRTLLI